MKLVVIVTELMNSLVVVTVAVVNIIAKIYLVEVLFAPVGRVLDQILKQKSAASIMMNALQETIPVRSHVLIIKADTNVFAAQIMSMLLLLAE